MVEFGKVVTLWAEDMHDDGRMDVTGTIENSLQAEDSLPTTIPLHESHVYCRVLAVFVNVLAQVGGAQNPPNEITA